MEPQVDSGTTCLFGTDLLSPIAFRRVSSVLTHGRFPLQPALSISTVGSVSGLRSALIEFDTTCRRLIGDQIKVDVPVVTKPKKLSTKSP